MLYEQTDQFTTKVGSILLTELVELHMVLQCITQHTKDVACCHIILFGDSEAAIGIVSMGWKYTNYQTIEKSRNHPKPLLKDTTLEAKNLPEDTAINCYNVRSETGAKSYTLTHVRDGWSIAMQNAH